MKSGRNTEKSERNSIIVVKKVDKEERKELKDKKKRRDEEWKDRLKYTNSPRHRDTITRIFAATCSMYIANLTNLFLSAAAASGPYKGGVPRNPLNTLTISKPQDARTKLPRRNTLLLRSTTVPSGNSIPTTLPNTSSSRMGGSKRILEKAFVLRLSSVRIITW